MGKIVNRHNTEKLIQSALVVVFVFAGSFWVAGVIRDNQVVQELVFKFGYAGTFLVSVISGFNLLVPIPAISFLPVFLAAKLNIYVSLLVITVGMTVGDLIGYALGRAGRFITAYSTNEAVVRRIERMRGKNYWWPVLFIFVYASSAPLPNELVVIPMAFMGYKLRTIALPLFFGNLLFNTMWAFGLSTLFDRLFV